MVLNYFCMVLRWFLVVLSHISYLFRDENNHPNAFSQLYFGCSQWYGRGFDCNGILLVLVLIARTEPFASKCGFFITIFFRERTFRYPNSNCRLHISSDIIYADQIFSNCYLYILYFVVGRVFAYMYRQIATATFEIIDLSWKSQRNHLLHNGTLVSEALPPLSFLLKTRTLGPSPDTILEAKNKRC